VGLGQTLEMLGAIIILVVLFVVLPLSFFGIGTFLSVLLGHFLRTEGEHMNEGSELIELNV
jgi:Na+/proline symporter